MFPAGFMAASAGEARGFPIVICTAQGSVTMDWDSAGGVHKQAPVKSMAHCPFAGHAIFVDRLSSRPHSSGVGAP
jgi:hypothetical protein